MNSTKKDLKRQENLEKLTNTINLLEILSRNNNVQRNLRIMIKDISVVLRDEKSGNTTVRAANAISMLDTITQNPQMQSHIRTMLWQVVSTLESIENNLLLHVSIPYRLDWGRQFFKLMRRVCQVMSRSTLPAEHNIAINTSISYSQNSSRFLYSKHG